MARFAPLERRSFKGCLIVDNCAASSNDQKTGMHSAMVRLERILDQLTGRELGIAEGSMLDLTLRCLEKAADSRGSPVEDALTLVANKVMDAHDMQRCSCASVVTNQDEFRLRWVRLRQRLV